MSTGLRIVGWTAALGVPLAIGYAFRRQAVWPLAVAALWAVVLVNLNGAAGSVPSYAWWALGGIGLMAWGVGDGRGERINMGATIFTATVITFYFSEVMDKLERSASLAGLGLLFLAGGWALERVRRRLIAQARGSS